MNVTQITTHVADAKARLIQQYKSKPRLEALISALSGEQIQALEDAAYAMRNRLNIDLSSGAQLDGIGAIVGQAREGRDDATYRLWIKARIGVNVSEGDIERVISIWKLLSGGTAVQLIEVFPAEIALYTNAPLPVGYESEILRIMRDVTGAGISVYPLVVFTTGYFGFDGDLDALGFGDTTDAGVGGTFSYITGV